MRNYLLTLIYLLLFLSAELFAAGGSGDRVIKTVQTADNWFAVYPEVGFDNPDSCEDTTKIVLWIERKNGDRFNFMN